MKWAIGLGLAGIAGVGAVIYFRKAHAATAAAASQAHAVAPTPPRPGGAPTLVNIAGAIGGAYGTVQGAALGALGVPGAGRPLAAFGSSYARTYVGATLQELGGVKQIATGHVVAGAKSVATGALKLAANPVTSGVKAVKSLKFW